MVAVMLLPVMDAAYMPGTSTAGGQGKGASLGAQHVCEALRCMQSCNTAHCHGLPAAKTLHGRGRRLKRPAAGKWQHTAPHESELSRPGCSSSAGATMWRERVPVQFASDVDPCAAVVTPSAQAVHSVVAPGADLYVPRGHATAAPLPGGR